MDRGGDLELLRNVCRRGIPPLPSAELRLALALAGDDESKNDSLIEQLEAEERLRFCVLAGANLAMIGKGRRITTIAQAVGHLGRRKCQSLLWSVALSDFMQAWPHLNDRARHKLWRHSLLTGVLAQELLNAAGFAALGDGLAAGIAHDLGHLLLVSPGYRLGVVWHEEHDLLVEKDVSPAPERDHCRLGASLLAFWDAPHDLISSALHHHDPRAVEAAQRPLVVAVRLADLLAEHLDLDRPVRPLRLESAAPWRELAALEPWGKVSQLHHLAVELLPESLAAADHLAHLLGR